MSKKKTPQPLWLKALFALGLLALLAVVGFSILFFLARQSTASEGYDTTEAARNYLFRHGEIRIRLAEGNELLELSADGQTGVIEEPREGFLRLDYGKFTPSFRYRDSQGKEHKLLFYTEKLNNWNRVLYLQDEDGEFSRSDNGVEQAPESIIILNSENGQAEPASAAESEPPAQAD